MNGYPPGRLYHCYTLYPLALSSSLSHVLVLELALDLGRYCIRSKISSLSRYQIFRTLYYFGASVLYCKRSRSLIGHGRQADHFARMQA